MHDYLIIAYITAVAGWYVTLPVLLVLAAWLVSKRYWIAAVVVGLAVLWFAIAAWEFVRYL